MLGDLAVIVGVYVVVRLLELAGRPAGQAPDWLRRLAAVGVVVVAVFTADALVLGLEGSGIVMR